MSETSSSKTSSMLAGTPARLPIPVGCRVHGGLQTVAATPVRPSARWRSRTPSAGLPSRSCLARPVPRRTSRSLRASRRRAAPGTRAEACRAGRCPRDRCGCPAGSGPWPTDPSSTSQGCARRPCARTDLGLREALDIGHVGDREQPGRDVGCWRVGPGRAPRLHEHLLRCLGRESRRPSTRSSATQNIGPL